MIASYVGLVTHHGLELFLPETEPASRFMQHRLRRCGQGFACGVWFVLEGGLAELVGELIACDEGDAAWIIVEQQARDGGFLMPEHSPFGNFTPRR